MNVVIVKHILFSCLDGVRIKHPDYDHKALMASVGQKKCRDRTREQSKQ